MKPTFFVGLLLSIISLTTTAQTPNYLTMMSNGNINENHMVVDRFGNTYLTITYSGLIFIDGLDFYTDGPWTSLVLKFNHDGDLLWGYSFTGTGSITVQSIANDKGDGLAVAGNFNGSLNIDGETIVSQGLEEGFIAGFSPEGNIRYVNSFGTTLSDYAYSICVDKTGNKFILAEVHESFTFAGETIEPIGGVYPTVICKFNKFGAPADLIAFNNDNYIIYANMTIDNKNNLIINGRFNDHLSLMGTTMESAGFNYFAAKIDAGFNVVWTNVFPIGGFTNIKDMVVDKAGNPYLLFVIDTLTIDGNTFYNAAMEDVYMESVLCKLNKSTGGAKWANKLNSFGEVYGTSLAVNGLQNVAVGGYYKDYINYGAMELSNPGPDLWDSFILMVDPDGNAMNLFDFGDNNTYDELWNIEFDNTGDMHLYGICNDGFTIGDFTAEVDFGVGYWLSALEFGTYKSEAIDLPATFTMSPNPAVNSVQLKFNASETTNTPLQIIDITGNIVLTASLSNINDETLTIDISSLAAGAYIVKYNQQQQQLIVTK